MHLLVRVQARTGKSSLVIVALFLSFFSALAMVLGCDTDLGYTSLGTASRLFTDNVPGSLFFVVYFFNNSNQKNFWFCQKIMCTFLTSQNNTSSETCGLHSSHVDSSVMILPNRFSSNAASAYPHYVHSWPHHGGGCGAFQTCGTFSSTAQSIVATLPLKIHTLCAGLPSDVACYMFLSSCHAYTTLARTITLSVVFN